MKLVAGLGNPGPRYAPSRHNVGFGVVDELAQRWSCDVTRYEQRFEALGGEGQVESEKVLLLKPVTFMNLSGRSVGAIWRFYKLAISDVLVVHDDLDLPVGRIRLRTKGSAGGHRGLADVLRHLGTTEVSRLRVGIGRVHRDATVEYVLSRFAPEEREPIEWAVKRAADAVERWVRAGIEAAMNEFNSKPDEPSGPGDSPAGPVS
ncbi:MAG: aminoacyl-tRNA hydrolase [Planctomycetes bacterium]|nr:aminoacyl-tRNA hydrolase [Planctomycetota bacterium]